MPTPEPKTPLSFRDWPAALRQAGLSIDQQRSFGREVGRFLRACRERRTPASVSFAKAYLGDLPTPEVKGARTVLRWWFPTAPPVGSDSADPTGSGRSSIGKSKSVSTDGVNRAHLKRFGNPTVGDGRLPQPSRCERRSA